MVKKKRGGGRGPGCCLWGHPGKEPEGSNFWPKWWWGFCFVSLPKWKSLSRVRLLATPRTAARQASRSMGFSRQEYWSGLPCPPPEDLPNPGIEPRSPALQVDSLPAKSRWKHVGLPTLAKKKAVLMKTTRVGGGEEGPAFHSHGHRGHLSSPGDPASLTPAERSDPLLGG